MYEKNISDNDIENENPYNRVYFQKWKLVQVRIERITQDMEFSANFSTLLHKRGDLAATSRNTFESKDLFGWNFYKTKRGKGIFPFDRRHRVRQIFIVDCQLPHSERKILFNIFPGRDDIA